jgi:hypothetical protein
MNRRKVFGLLAIMVIVASIGSVAAFGGQLSVIDPQGRDKIINAIKANDYNAWKEAISAQLTEENFNNIVQRYQAMSQRHENMSEKRSSMFSERRVLSEEMNKTIQDGNYEAWKKAANNSRYPLISRINNEDDFKILVQLHQAKQQGDFEKVKELSAQLGLPVGNYRHKMYGNFGRGGMI